MSGYDSSGADTFPAATVGSVFPNFELAGQPVKKFCAHRIYYLDRDSALWLNHQRNN
jgi:hypothetical protein